MLIILGHESSPFYGPVYCNCRWQTQLNPFLMRTLLNDMSFMLRLALQLMILTSDKE